MVILNSFNESWRAHTEKRRLHQADGWNSSDGKKGKDIGKKDGLLMAFRLSLGF